MGITVNGTAWDITLYLAEHGINADDVFVDSWDENGYESVVRDANGRPTYGNTGASRTLLREQKRWPSPEIPENITRIQNGQPTIVYEAPVKEKPAPKPKEEPKK